MKKEIKKQKQSAQSILNEMHEKVSDESGYTVWGYFNHEFRNEKSDRLVLAAHKKLNKENKLSDKFKLEDLLSFRGARHQFDWVGYIKTKKAAEEYVLELNRLRVKELLVAPFSVSKHKNTKSILSY